MKKAKKITSKRSKIELQPQILGGEKITLCSKQF